VYTPEGGVFEIVVENNILQRKRIGHARYINTEEGYAVIEEDAPVPPGFFVHSDEELG
jgi:hypothetical protein